MKSASISETSTISRPAVRRRISDYFEMTKPRLSFMSVISAIVGYLAATPARDIPLFASVLVGTACAAGGAAVLNELIEHKEDGLMRRTAGRPIPAGLVTPLNALVYGLCLSLAGTMILWFGANPTAGALTATTILSYLLIYTPMKKFSPWAAEIGAVPGALPPLIGWTAATGGFALLGWVLFAILFAWQMTHFLAISWNCREDYRLGGFRTLSVVDPDGQRVSQRALGYAALLAFLTILLIPLGLAGLLFAAVGPMISLWFLWEAIRFHRMSSKNAQARRLFFASVIHLPLLLLILVIDRFLF